MRVCIIGAGAAGLTTAKHLSEEGISFDILEKRDELGGMLGPIVKTTNRPN
ncbi:MAG: FAD-dependent oxidoreductase [Caldilinea sp.]